MKRIKLKSNVKPFIGRLRRTVMKKTVRPIKLDKKEIEAYVQKHGTNPPVSTKPSSEWANLFAVYTYLIEIDQFFIKLQKRVNNNKHEVKDVLLRSKYLSAYNYIKRMYREDLEENYIQNHRITNRQLDLLETKLLALAMQNIPMEEKIKKIRSHVRTNVFKNRLLGSYTRFMLQAFRLLKYSVSTKTRKNSALRLEYTQFKFDTRTEEIIKQSSFDVVEEREARKRLLKVQEETLKRELEERESPLVAVQEPLYVKLGEDEKGRSKSEKQFVVVGYHPSVSNLREKPKKKDFSVSKYPTTNIKDVTEVTVGRGEKKKKVSVNKKAFNKEMESWREEKKSYVAEIYSPVLRNASGDGYEKFEKYDKLETALEEKRQEQFLKERLTPKVILPKDVKLKEGERPIAKVVFGQGQADLEYELPNFASELDTELAQETKPYFRQITDREGSEVSDVAKIYPVKKLEIDGDQVEVISEGPFAGFKFDEMVNAMGRVVDNVYYDSEENPIKLIDMGLDAESFGLGRGFLEVEKSTNTKSGYSVVKNRLVEPYVTVSSDGEQLMIGLPNKKMYKNDRATMKKLKKAQIVTQYDYALISTRQQGSNPFYLFTPENYSVVKNKLGSLSISKPARDLIKKYERELEVRNRALEPENVSRFDSALLGGFKEEVFEKQFDFNDKQKEGMAWIESNGFKGVMSLDTGVGKTLFGGGTMQNFMNLENEKIADGESILNKNGKTKKFLFVSPKRLVGNFSAEMYDFMKDEGVISNRIVEMSYFVFARTVSAMNGMEEVLKPNAKASLKKYRMKFVEGTDFLNKDKTKLNYDDANEYFLENYNIIFMDEINDALKPAIKKSVSELEHPRKILLTASPMEKDPLDLYRFVAISKGIKPDKKKEQEFLDDYANIIGGRFVGITDDLEKRTQFEKWVAENAYFALKEDVDLPKINMPRLLKPTYENVRLRMDDEVKAEYKKRASSLSKNLKGMVEKYRDIIKLKKADKISDKELEKRMKGLEDYAVVGMADSLKELQTLATNPEEILPGVSNPKIEEAISIASKREGKKILYFSHLEKMVKKNAQSISKRVSGLHVAMGNNDIVFFKNGEPLYKVNKNTSVGDLIKMNKNLRLASSNPPVFFMEKGMVKEEDLNRVLAKILGGDILLKVIVDKKGGLVKKYDSDLPQRYKVVPWHDSPEIMLEYKERKDPNQWAIGASKLIFKKNKNIRTVSCTDEYARGFNFQFTTTVVHLDRGAGFDSEIVKQRTARSYRTKQDQRVEVLFLDATIAEKNEKEIEVENGVKVKVNCNSAEDQTIDEIQDLVQGVDQDFFMSIINKAMKTKLKEDGTISDLGESYRMNRQVLSQIIDPTGKNLSKMRESLAKERQNPLLTSARDPKRFLSSDLKASFEIESDISEDTVESNLDLCGVSSFAAFNFSSQSFANSVSENEVISNGRLLKQSTSLEKDEDGFISVRNNKLSVTKCAPRVTGTRAIVAQITASLARTDVKEIIVMGETSDKTHYIWPKLGFNAEVRLPFLVDEKLNERDNTDEGRSLIKIKEWLVSNRRPIGENGEVCLLNLYSCVDSSGELIGQEWWLKNGFPVELKINLSNPKNSSLKFFNSYFVRRCEELEIETDEFLSLEPQPFDIDQPACWLDFLKRYREIKDSNGRVLNPTRVINSYFDAFMIAYVSRRDVRTRAEPFIQGLPTTKRKRLQSNSEVTDEAQNVETGIFDDPDTISRYANSLVMKSVHERETKTLDSMWRSRSKSIEANVAHAEILESENLDIDALDLIESDEV